MGAKTALVLSGGGMRGAYEVGVVAGIVDILALRARDEPPFRIFAGTSVGAINATYFAASAQRGDHDVHRLREVWSSLKVGDHALLRPFGLVQWPRRLRRSIRNWLDREGSGSSLLDTRGLERVVTDTVDWQQLHTNVSNGTVTALLIAALHVVSGRTTIFAELAPDCHFTPARDERRTAQLEPIEADHVLASAAIPLLFPTRRIGDSYYCDGGLRFNTPIAPAIRAGADRVVVVSVRHERSLRETDRVEANVSPEAGRDLSPLFLAGKLLNALLLDPVAYDLAVLERLNELMVLLEQTLEPHELEQFQQVLERARGTGYRKIETLVFTPSRDLGRIAGTYLRTSLRDIELNPLTRRLLERAARGDPGQEADWASYLLFDGGFAEQIMSIGYQDAQAKADGVLKFFGA